MLRPLRWMAGLLAAVLALLCACPRWRSPRPITINVPQLLKEGHLYAESAVLMDAVSGEVLFAEKRRRSACIPPAPRR